ncbi:MAG: hypothetical protein ABSH07_11890 [Candidatus Dormibacteria bacterium]|jgi:hypothetical protein
MAEMVRTISDVARELPPLGRQGRWVDGTFLPSTAWIRITEGSEPGHTHAWAAAPIPEGALGGAAECPCGARARWRPVSLGPEVEQATALEELRDLAARWGERLRRGLRLVMPS